MALTKFDIASASLVMVGAEPVASFDGTGSAEQIACYHLYQSCLDAWLSLYPWRFASRITRLARDATPPLNQWQQSYTVPSGMRSIQALTVDESANPIPFDRFENHVFCNASTTQKVYCTHTYEPPVAWWPGYFVSLMEISFAARLSFALAGKLDLRTDLEKGTDTAFRYARNADSNQQTTRKFRVDGRRSIMEARRA